MAPELLEEEEKEEEDNKDDAKQDSHGDPGNNNNNDNEKKPSQGIDPFACDVYAFGMVMYEVTVGHHPWHNMKPISLSVAVLKGKRPELPPLSPSSSPSSLSSSPPDRKSVV